MDEAKLATMRTVPSDGTPTRAPVRRKALVARGLNHVVLTETDSPHPLHCAHAHRSLISSLVGGTQWFRRPQDAVYLISLHKPSRVELGAHVAYPVDEDTDVLRASGRCIQYVVNRPGDHELRRIFSHARGQGHEMRLATLNFCALLIA